MKLLHEIRYRINMNKSYAVMDRKKRTTKEIFDKKMEIQAIFLRLEREEKNTDIIKAQLDVFNWILGEA